MSHLDHQSDLLAAPFRVRDGLHVVGRALWLYQWLVVNANAKGIVCRRSKTIARALAIPEAEALDWLGRLVVAGLVETQSGAPYLIMKLRFWSGSTSSGGQNGVTGVASDRAIDESLHKLASKPASNNTDREASTGVGVTGEGGSDLLAEIREAIGTDDGLEDLLSRVPEAVIRTALAKTLATPDEQIKKSRAALFWFLIGKHANPHA